MGGWGAKWEWVGGGGKRRQSVSRPEVNGLLLDLDLRQTGPCSTTSTLDDVKEKKNRRCSTLFFFFFFGTRRSSTAGFARGARSVSIYLFVLCVCVCVCVSVGARQKRKQDHLEDTVKVAVMSLECCGPATQKDGGVCGREGGSTGWQGGGWWRNREVLWESRARSN